MLALKAETIGVDGTTLEANAALKSLVRREDGQKYRELLESLAKTSGIATPTAEDLARLDRNRAGKGSNDEWKNPHDPDAQITKMKDGSTHMAHQAENAVDLDSGAVLAVSSSGETKGDTTTIFDTLLGTVRTHAPTGARGNPFTHVKWMRFARTGGLIAWTRRELQRATCADTESVSETGAR